MNIYFSEISFSKGSKSFVFSYPPLDDTTFWSKNNHPLFVSHRILSKENIFVKYFQIPNDECIRADIIPGLHFIEGIQKQEIEYLPFIHDLKVLNERETTGYFLFMELLDNRYPLDKIVLGSKKQLRVLYRQLSRSLKAIHQRGYWHSDFKEGNILLSSGNFFVVDIDSVHPIDHPFDYLKAPHVHKDLTIAVSRFLYPSQQTPDLRGDALNLLQLVMLISIHKFRKFSGPYLHLSKVIDMPSFLKHLRCDALLDDFRTAFNGHRQMISDTPDETYRWLATETDHLINKMLGE